AGYDTRHKTDYRAKAAEEVSKVQQKARLLEEMLQGYSAGDEVQEGDVFEELANALASAHPKIQKMCEEESDDTEAVAKLLEINDSIHRTIQRYRLVKNGDIEGANAIPKGTLGVSGAGVKKGPDNELSLIDFGGPDEAGAESSQQPAATASADLMAGEAEQPAGSAAPQPKGNALEDDLLGLSMGGGDFGSGGGISLGAPTNGASSADIMSQFNQPAQQQTASNSIFSSQQALPHPQQQQQPAAQPQAPKANYDPFSSLSASNSRPSSMSPTPIPSAAQQQQAAAAKKPADPFAALASTPRSGSPFQFQQSTSSGKSPAPPATSQTPQAAGGGLDLLGMGDSTAPAQPQQQQQAAGGDDEWTFSSALPDQPHELAVTNSSIKTVFSVKRDNDTEIQLQSKISNNTAQPITDLTFQLAVTKGYTLALQPQSSRSLGPNQQNGITQSIRLQGCQRGQGTAVKMRWRASYTLNGQQQNEQGEIAGLGVS
ncbi:hypothetical protein KC366_g16365, partial [Hortaea werneckii]